MEFSPTVLNFVRNHDETGASASCSQIRSETPCVFICITLTTSPRSQISYPSDQFRKPPRSPTSDPQDESPSPHDLQLLALHISLAITHFLRPRIVILVILHDHHKSSLRTYLLVESRLCVLHCLPESSGSATIELLQHCADKCHLDCHLFMAPERSRPSLSHCAVVRRASRRVQPFVDRQGQIRNGHTCEKQGQHDVC